MPSVRHLVPLERTHECTPRSYHPPRYGNHDDAQRLPFVDDRDVIVETEDSFFNNLQIHKTVGEWYESWRPWQQTSLLCGMADRLSIYQLEALGTSLEPLQHRDYVNSSLQIYPSAEFSALPDKLQRLEQMETKKTRKKRSRKKHNGKRRSVNFSRSQTQSSLTSVGGESKTRSVSDLSGRMMALEEIVALDDVNNETDEELEAIGKALKYGELAESISESILSSAMRLCCERRENGSNSRHESGKVFGVPEHSDVDCTSVAVEREKLRVESFPINDCVVDSNMDGNFRDFVEDKSKGCSQESRDDVQVERTERGVDRNSLVSDSYNEMKEFASEIAEEIISTVLPSCARDFSSCLDEGKDESRGQEHHVDENVVRTDIDQIDKLGKGSSRGKGHNGNTTDGKILSFMSVNSLGNVTIISHDCLGRVVINKRKVTDDIKIMPTISESPQGSEADCSEVIDVCYEDSMKNHKGFCLDVVTDYANLFCNEIIDSALNVFSNHQTNDAHCTMSASLVCDKDHFNIEETSVIKSEIMKDTLPNKQDKTYEDENSDVLRKEGSNVVAESLNAEPGNVDQLVECGVDQSIQSLQVEKGTKGALKKRKRSKRKTGLKAEDIKESKRDENQIVDTNYDPTKNSTVPENLYLEDDPDVAFHQEYKCYHGETTSSFRIVSPTDYYRDAFDRIGTASQSPINHRERKKSFNRLTRSLSPNLLRSRERSARTPEFFPSSTLQMCGFTGKLMRHGRVHRPSHIDDIDMPLQNCYKHEKWCHPSDHNSSPKHKKLARHYKRQLSQIWEWLGCWGEFEQTALLTGILKLSDPPILSTLYSHIQFRLNGTYRMHHLTDDLLLRIMTYLPTSDLYSCTFVSRHWYYLTNCQKLWRNKCQQIGVTGVGDLRITLLAQMIGGKLCVDWKKAYYDMECIRREVTAPPTVKFDLKLGKQAREPVQLADQGREPSDLNQSLWDIDEVPSVDPELWDRRPETTNSEKRRRRFKRKYTRNENVQTAMREVSPQLVHGDDGGNDGADGFRSPTSSTRGRKFEADSVEDATFEVRPTLVQARDLLGNHHASHSLRWVSKDTNMEAQGVVAFVGDVKKVTRVQKLQGHLNGVMCLAFDQKRLVSGGLDCTIRLWDVRSGRCLQKFFGHKGGIYCLDFDGPSHTLVTGSWDTTIMVWNLYTFERVAVLHEHRDCVTGLKLTPQYIVSGSYDSTVRVYRRDTLTQHTVIQHHTSAVTCIDVQGRHVFSASWQGRVLMTELTSGECVREFRGCGERITSIKIQKKLLCAGDKMGRLYFWSKSSGQEEAVFQIHEASVNKIAFLNSRLYTASQDLSVKEWDIATMTLIRSFDGHKGPVEDLQVSDHRIATGSNDGHVFLWNLEHAAKKGKSHKKKTRDPVKLPPL